VFALKLTTIDILSNGLHGGHCGLRRQCRRVRRHWCHCYTLTIEFCGDSWVQKKDGWPSEQTKVYWLPEQTNIRNSTVNIWKKFEHRSWTWQEVKNLCGDSHLWARLFNARSGGGREKKLQLLSHSYWGIKFDPKSSNSIRTIILFLRFYKHEIWAKSHSWDSIGMLFLRSVWEVTNKLDGIPIATPVSGSRYHWLYA